MIWNLVAMQKEGLAMGNSASGPLAVGDVMVATHEMFLKLPPHTPMVPAVGYADDTGEVTLDGYSWMQSVLEPELAKHNMSLESTDPLLMTEGFQAQHMQFLISITNGVLSLTYNPKDKGNWRYPVILPHNRKFLAVPILIGILCSYWDYSTHPDLIFPLMLDIIPWLKGKYYRPIEWQMAVLKFRSIDHEYQNKFLQLWQQ